MDVDGVHPMEGSRGRGLNRGVKYVFLSVSLHVKWCSDFQYLHLCITSLKFSMYTCLHACVIKRNGSNLIEVMEVI